MDEEDIITLDPVIVTGEDLSDVGGLGDNLNWSDWNIDYDGESEDGGYDYGPDDNTAPTSIESIVVDALNKHGEPGWKHIGGTEYKNERTGQTYNSLTGVVTNPPTSNETSAGKTKTISSGGGGSGGSSGGISTGGGGGNIGSRATSDALNKTLQTLGALVNSFTKVNNALNPDKANAATKAANAAAQAQQDEAENAAMGKIIAIGAAAIGGLILLKKLLK